MNHSPVPAPPASPAAALPARPRLSIRPARPARSVPCLTVRERSAVTVTTALTLPRPRRSQHSTAPGLMPVRPIDPPYDDEVVADGRNGRAAPRRPVDRSRVGRPVRGSTPTAPREVTSGARRLAERGAVLRRSPQQQSFPLVRRGDADPDRSAPARLPGTNGDRSGLSPDPRRTAAVVVRLIVEVLSGARPMTHLAPWTTAALQHDLQRTAAAITNRQSSQVRSVRVSEPLPGVAEVSAVISRGQRARALALRMEHRADRWQVTTLQLG